MKYALIWLVINTFLCTTAGYTQTERPADSLLWIHAVNDTAANYFDAVASFNSFWKDKRHPPGEFEEEDDLHTAQADPNAPYIKYAIPYRRFLIWQESMHPFIYPDGRIMTPSDRIRLWQSTKGK